MEQIRKLLEERKEYLLRLKSEKEKSLRTAPEGMLRVCSSRNRVQYYQRTDPKDFNGIYIKEKDAWLARGLAQKDYDQKILKVIENELEYIEKYLSSDSVQSAEQVYERLHKERQKLICPIRETDEQYVQKWKAIEYEGKGFAEDAPEFYTNRGERVRSKSEKMKADKLKRLGVPYRYEAPLYLGRNCVLHPDFTVLNIRTRKEYYYEHFGMMDKPEYVESALKRIELYEKNGIFPGDNLLFSWETMAMPLNMRIVETMLRRYVM